MSIAAPPTSARADAAPPAMSAPAMLAGIAIVAAAAGLRLWNIGAGIPHNLGQDEPQIINRVVHMMNTGDFNPHFFDWPSLTIYLNLVVACGTFLLGAMRGLWNNLDQMPAADLYLAGRQFTALVGTATVAVTFAIGRRWGTGVALAAAALMAVVPNHVRESHYVLTDVPTAFFTTLTLLLALRAYERPTTGRLLWAAAAAGLAASCKYNGSIAVVMPLVVAWARGGGLTRVMPRMLAVLGVALAAFLIGTPYAIADLPAFLNDYARLASTFARERPGESGSSIYLKHLMGAFSWPALALAAAGLLVVLRRVVSGPARVPSLLLVTFTVIYFFVMATSYQIYGRYLLPLFAPLAVAAAIAAVGVAGRLRQSLRSKPAGAAAASAVIVLLLLTPAMGAWMFSRDLARPSTVDLAYQWILANVPAGAKVAVEAGALRLPDSYPAVAVRLLTDRGYDDYASEGVTHLLAASPQFQASLRDPVTHRDAFVAYRTLLSRTAEVAAFEPSATVSGPSLRLYQMPR